MGAFFTSADFVMAMASNVGRVPTLSVTFSIELPDVAVGNG